MPQSLRRVSRAAAVVRLAATVLVVVVASTCVRDESTAPTLRTAPLGAVRGTYTTLGTYSIPIPLNNTDGGAQPVANTGIFVPAGTYYRVRVNGTVTVSDNPDYVQWYGTPFAEEGTYGPFGTSQGELVVQLKARFTDGSGTNTINFVNPQHNSGTSGPDSARSDVLYASKAIEVQAGRSGIAGAANDNCCHWQIGMFALAASQTVTVEQATDVAHVVANPVAVHPNTQVTFTASRDDGGNLIVYNWHWQPDAGQPGNAGDLCGGGNPCLKTVAGSGTMTVYTNVGNPTAHVVVYQATNPDTSFRLVADRSTAVIADTVTFTPLYNGVPGPAARWRWAPSDTTTHDNTACSSGVSPCKKVMVTSGTMWAYTSVTAGQGDSASTSVNVVCATNDTLLNLPVLREGLAALDQMSRGGSTEPGNRHEMGGYLFWNPTTNQYQYILSFTNDATACSWRDQPWPSAGNGWWQMARSHSHPYRPKRDTLPAGTMCGLHRLQVPSVPQPGPSAQDDSVATDGFPSFVVDADSVYRTDGPGIHHSWRRNAGSCQLLPPAELERIPWDRWFLPNSVTRKTVPRLTQRRIR